MRLAKRFAVVLIVALMTAALLVSFAYADDGTLPGQAASGAVQSAESGDNSVGLKALAVCIAIGLAAAGGAVGMGMVGGKAADGISRQPEMEGKIPYDAHASVSGVYRNGHHLRAAGRHTGHLRPVRR